MQLIVSRILARRLVKANGTRSEAVSTSSQTSPGGTPASAASGEMRHVMGPLLLPGMTRTVDMVADNPGTWMLQCDVHDHETAGMKALFNVQPAVHRYVRMEARDFKQVSGPFHAGAAQ